MPARRPSVIRNNHGHRRLRLHFALCRGVSMRGLNKRKIGVIGLGYVGLPLAVEFGKKYRTIGFDINLARIKERKSGRDSTLEATAAELKASRNLRFSSKTSDLTACNVFIVT